MQARVESRTARHYGGSASFEAGVGEKARAGARIILERFENSGEQ